MVVAELVRSEPTSLKDSKLTVDLQELRQTDNVTNFYYLARTWLYLVTVIGVAAWFFHLQGTAGWSFAWNIPVALIAITLIGAGQHQLTGLAHEASHHILFRHRLLNDLVSDWCCMFPMFSTTHHYRLQHLAHHQFVNDPDRDPDVSQLRTSGHWLDFPVSKQAFLRTLLKQLYAPHLIRFIRIRAKYNSMGTDKNPYLRKGVAQSKIPVRAGIAYILGLIVLLTALVMHGDSWLLAVLPLGAWIAIEAFYRFIPDRLYHQSRVHPVIAARWMTMMRMMFISVLFNALAWITHWTGHWAAAYFFVLWVAPMFTSFAFFMVLRQLVQHGNGDRGWLTNTRVFFVNCLIKHSVFPMGQEYHLPHHMFATVPHYRLARLHQLLLEYPEYRDQATVVDGYFLPTTGQETPTVLDVLSSPRPSSSGDVYVDDSVLNDEDVDDKESILREADALRCRTRHAATTFPSESKQV